MQNARLNEGQTGIKIAKRNINNLRYADDTTLMAESKAELRNSRWRWKRRVKSWLKTQHSKIEGHGIWSHHFIANRWKTMETVTDFIFLGSQITADGDCRHEIKRLLAPWKKRYDKPRQHIKKQRRYFADKGPYRQNYGFSSTYEWMRVLDHKKGWVLRNWCF